MSVKPVTRLATALAVSLSVLAVVASGALAAPTIEGSEAIFKTLPTGIIPRQAWDPKNECAPKNQPDLGRVDVGFVHHTHPTPNNYKSQDVPGLIKGICLSHRNGNGWADVGYHFFADKDGRLWEGRAGGIDKALVGAQTYGFNKVSTSIAVLGDFQTEHPSDKSLEAVAALLAWKLGVVHKVPVEGTITEENGDKSVRGQFEKVQLHRISGHCDGFSTACPGDQLYKQLPTIRQLAAAILQRANIS